MEATLKATRVPIALEHEGKNVINETKIFSHLQFKEELCLHLFGKRRRRSKLKVNIGKNIWEFQGCCKIRKGLRELEKREGRIYQIKGGLLLFLFKVRLK